MPDNATGRRRLDDRLRQFEPAALQTPHRGWIRAVRDALGMSSAELGARLGVTQQTVADLERSERQGTIKLETLERVARALNCELVYALVPPSSLEEVVQTQARTKARALLATVSRHSQLEDQSVTDSDLRSQVADVATQLIDRRGLWREDGTAR